MAAPRWSRRPDQGSSHHTDLGRDGAPRAAAGARAATASASRRRTASARWPGTTTGIWRSTTPRPGMQAICHTINPAPAPDDIAYIINHAGDRVLFVDPGFAPLIGGIAARIKDSVRAVVMMTDAAIMPALDLPRGMRLLCYDELMAAADDDYAWPELRREHRERAVLHLRHHRAAEGRAVQPPLHGAARLCDRAARRAAICAPPAASCPSCRCSTSTPGAFPTPPR